MLIINHTQEQVKTHPQVIKTIHPKLAIGDISNSQLAPEFLSVLFSLLHLRFL
jgi:hypothetical protein